MGLVFHNGKFMPEHDIQKASAESAILRRLRAFLDANEPGLVRFLVNTWNAQGKAITYKELREAILAGEISADLLDDWMQDYSRFVAEHMLPAWEKAIAAGVAALESKYPDWHFDPMGAGVRSWTEKHAAEFVTNVTATQIEGLRAVVRRAAVLEDLSVDELSRVIRPMVGLYKGQAEANLKYYETLIANGTSQKRALDLSTRYAARQHRYRSMMIARQELAMAYNTGADLGVRQAQAAGYMGETVKVFCTALDERTCPTCGGLEGAIVGMDEEFQVANRGRYRFTGLYPPVHIQCRCAVMYEEVGEPKIKRGTD